MQTTKFTQSRLQGNFPDEPPETPFWVEIKPTGRMMRMAEVINRIGLSRSQIYAMIEQGDFPPLVKLSRRAARLPEAWLDAFIVNRAKDGLSVSSNALEEMGDVQ